MAKTSKRKAGGALRVKSMPNVKIPRTYKAAKSLGYEAADVAFDDLSKQHKASFMQFDGGGPGAFCGLGPSSDPNYWLVCYKDASGNCQWVHVPRGAALQSHS